MHSARSCCMRIDGSSHLQLVDARLVFVRHSKLSHFTSARRGNSPQGCVRTLLHDSHRRYFHAHRVKERPASPWYRVLVCAEQIRRQARLLSQHSLRRRTRGHHNFFLLHCDGEILVSCSPEKARRQKSMDQQHGHELTGLQRSRQVVPDTPGDGECEEVYLCGLVV